MKPKIKIFINHPECSLICAAGMQEALSLKFKIDYFQTKDIKESLFTNTDIVGFPGGIGDSDSFDKILKPQADIIRNYVSRGGRYLGICMGAYWAGRHYFNILNNVKAVQYIKRPNTTIKRSFSTTTTVDWLGEKHNMFFYDGCALKGDESKFDVIARYANKDPMAIIQNNIGIIGCHPESMPSWYNKKYLKPHWHFYKHHKLLLEFTQKLMLS